MGPVDIRHGLDAEHLAVIDALPEDCCDVSDMAAARARLAAQFEARETPPAPPGVSVADVEVISYDDQPITVRTYAPAPRPDGRPTLLWIHGGGMVVGSPSMNDDRCLDLADSMGIFVASVDYRLAPEHPYPTPLEDCYAALTWLRESSESLGVDRSRIAIGGASAGGGLAAGLALLARDRDADAAICFQLLSCPMLDHRPSSTFHYEFSDQRLWNPTANSICWSAYLGVIDEGGTVPGYASPALAHDLTGLPPALITVGDHDLFVTEDMAYASSLLRHGVPTELHVYPGAIHGSTMMVPESEISQRWLDDERDALRRALTS